MRPIFPLEIVNYYRCRGCLTSEGVTVKLLLLRISVWTTLSPHELCFPSCEQSGLCSINKTAQSGCRRPIHVRVFPPGTPPSALNHIRFFFLRFDGDSVHASRVTNSRHFASGGLTFCPSIPRLPQPGVGPSSTYMPPSLQDSICAESSPGCHLKLAFPLLIASSVFVSSSSTSIFLLDVYLWSFGRCSRDFINELARFPELVKCAIALMKLCRRRCHLN